jgi:UDP:flavonoid glycosyltransferase YjiC (YdhE family)
MRALFSSTRGAGHGGSGSTLGALAAGVPLAVLPLFADQPQNARRGAEVGAGVAVEPNR